jgi:prepilin-type N-terminal cleavage/methylation domain-containing protein
LRGLTLIEVLVTLTCMAVAMVIVMPALGDRSSERLRGAAQVLIADLEYAQSESMSHGDNPRVIAVESDNAGYRIATRSDPATPVTNPASASPYVMRFGTVRGAGLGGVRVKAHTFGADNRLGFGALGQLDQTSAATITFQCGSHTIVVTIDPATGEATTSAVQ